MNKSKEGESTQAGRLADTFIERAARQNRAAHNLAIIQKLAACTVNQVGQEQNSIWAQNHEQDNTDNGQVEGPAS